MKASALVPAFNAGELSPLLQSRVDLAKHGTAAGYVLNWLPLPEGPLVRRPGSQFMGSAVNTVSHRSWLKAFVFGLRDSWLLEFSDDDLRFWTRGGLVLDGSSQPYTLSTPWTAATLEDEGGSCTLKTAQARDRVFIASGKVRPQLLERRGPAAWTLTAFDPVDGPFDPENTDDAQTFYVTGSATVGSSVVVVKAGGSGLGLLPLVDGTYNQLLRLYRAPGSTVRPWEVGATIVENDVRRADGKFYRANNAGTSGATRPTHTEGMAWDASGSGVQWEFLHAGYGDIRITGVNGDGNFVGTVVRRLPAEVIGSGNATARWQVSPWAPPVTDLDLSTVDYSHHNAGVQELSLVKNPAVTVAVGAQVTVMWQSAASFYSFGGLGSIVRINYASGPAAIILLTSGPLAFGDYIGVLLQVPTASNVVNNTDLGSRVWRTQWLYGPRPVLISHPEAVGFAFDRLVFGRGNRLWFSRVDDFFSFDDRSFGEILTDDAISITLTGERVTRIMWLEEVAAGLLVGTDGGEFLVRAANSAEVFGSVLDATRNIEAKRQTTYGSSGVAPVLAHGRLLMVDATGRRLRELERTFEADRVSGFDLTALAGHILGPGVRWMAWQGQPDNLLWLGLADGSLVSCTYLPEQEITAFARHRLAGIAGDGLAYAESGEVIPSEDGSTAELWLVVRRTIEASGPVTVRDVERLAPRWDHANDNAAGQSRHLDSHIVYSGEPVSSISGASHLKNLTVPAMVGDVVASLEVANDGTATLPESASSVVVGLPYRSEVRFLVADAGGTDGPGIMKRRRARELILTVLQSCRPFLAGYVGRLRHFDTRGADEALDGGEPLVTDDLRVPLDLGWKRRPVHAVAVESPLPFTLCAAMLRLEVTE